MAPGPEGGANLFTLGDLLGCLIRHRALSAAFGFGTALLVLLATWRITPLFEASATLAAEPRGKARDFEVDPTSGKVEYSMLNTIRDKLRARPVVMQALEESGLVASETYAPLGNPVYLAQKRLSVETSKDSMAMQIRFRDERPEAAQRMLEELLDAFHQAQIQAYASRSSDALSFLARSKRETEQQLATLRARELELRREHDLVDDSPTDNVHAQRLRRLTDQLAVQTRDLTSAQALMDQVAAARDAQAPIDAQLGLEAIARHPVVVEQRRLLYALEDARVLLRQKYLAKHPRMLEIEEQIRAKREHLEEAVGMAASGVEARLDELQRQRQGLLAQIEDAERALQVYHSNLVDLTRVQKEIATTEKILDSLREHLAEQQILASLEAHQATVIDPPKAGSGPVNIKRTLFAAAAVFLGTVAACVTAVAAEMLSRKVRSLDRALDTTRMAIVGRMPSVGKLWPLAKDPQLEASEPMAEAIRALRARLILATRQHEGPRRIAITSACPGDGKSTIAARLAASLAAAGERVLIIDGDLRAPRLGQEFELDQQEGLTDILRGHGVMPTAVPQVERLSFIGAGQTPENPSELLHAPALNRLLGEIAPRTADWIIVDTPPLGRVSDALIIGEQIDYLLLVVREDHTLRTDLRRAVGQLAPLQDKVLGMVYNAQVRSSMADAYAGYGRGGYGGYGVGTRRIAAGTGTVTKSVGTDTIRSL